MIRSRTFWALTGLLTFLAVSVLLSLSFWCRDLALRGLPDIPEPVDVEAFAHVEIVIHVGPTPDE